MVPPKPGRQRSEFWVSYFQVTSVLLYGSLMGQTCSNLVADEMPLLTLDVRLLIVWAACHRPRPIIGVLTAY